MPTAFVLMPFGGDFDSFYEKVLKPTLEEQGFDVNRADDFQNRRNILKDVMEGISNGDLIVADLTGRNANVFYELATAHSFKKPVLMITQSIDDVPFDLSNYRLLEYSISISGLDETRAKIRNFAASFLGGDVSFSNPVTDFYPHNDADEPLSGNISKDISEWKTVKDDNGNNLYSKRSFQVSLESREYRIRDLVNGGYLPEAHLEWRWVARHHGQFIKAGKELPELFKYCDDFGKHSP